MTTPRATLGRDPERAERRAARLDLRVHLALVRQVVVQDLEKHGERVNKTLFDTI